MPPVGYSKLIWFRSLGQYRPTPLLTMALYRRWKHTESLQAFSRLISDECKTLRQCPLAIWENGIPLWTNLYSSNSRQQEHTCSYAFALRSYTEGSVPFAIACSSAFLSWGSVYTLLSLCTVPCQENQSIIIKYRCNYIMESYETLQSTVSDVAELHTACLLNCSPVEGIGAICH